MRIVCQETVEAVGYLCPGGTVENSALSLEHHYLRSASGGHWKLCTTLSERLIHKPKND